MDAPQSLQDVAPIEAAIRQTIDDQLRIRWNPESVVTRPGSFDCYGFPIPPQKEGRWEVGKWVRYPDRRELEWCTIYQVRYDGEGNEAYRPVGWWLLDFLQKWDRANAHWIDEMKALADAEEAMRISDELHAEQEMREALEQHGRNDLKMHTHIGRGFGKGPRRDRLAHAHP